MKVLKSALHCYLKFLVSIAMSFFVVVSCVFVMNMIASTETGYEVYEFNETTRKNEYLYDHSFDEGEDPLYPEYEEQGKILTKTAIRVLSEKWERVAYAISIFFSVGLSTATLYSCAWNIGNKDSNAVRFQKMEADRLRGIKIGGMVAIPSFILYLILCLCRFGVLKPNFLSIFRVLNSHLYGVIYLIYGKVALASQLAFWQMLLLFVTVLFPFAVTAIGYRLGYRDVSLFDKTVYKKK